MGWVVYLALIVFAIISSNKKKQAQAAKKASRQAERPNRPEVSEGVPFEPREGECAPEHMHSAQTEERHVLKPSFETGHVHTESPMDRTVRTNETCPTVDGKGTVLQGEHSTEAIRMPKKGGNAPKSKKPEEASVSAPPADEAVPVPVVDLSTEKMREAIILSEILAKPKALRR